MLDEALSYPRNGDDSLTTLLIGGAVVLIGVFVPLLPQIVLNGYVTRVLRSSAAGEEVPPRFEGWGDLFVDGVKLFAIQLAYAIPVVIISVAFAASVLVITGVETAPGTGGSSFGGPGALFVFLLALVVALGLLVGYVLPAALANFAYHDRLGRAFAFREVLSVSFTSDYLVAWVLVVVGGVLLGLVGALLSIVLVGFVVLFYVQVVAYYLFGRGYANGRRKRGLADGADADSLT